VALCALPPLPGLAAAAVPGRRGWAVPDPREGGCRAFFDTWAQVCPGRDLRKDVGVTPRVWVTPAAQCRVRSPARHRPPPPLRKH